MTVTLGDARAAGYCWAGIRLFTKRHGIDWKVFIREGVSAEALPDDAMSNRVIEKARAREANNGR